MLTLLFRQGGGSSVAPEYRPSFGRLNSASGQGGSRQVQRARYDDEEVLEAIAAAPNLAAKQTPTNSFGPSPLQDRLSAASLALLAEMQDRLRAQSIAPQILVPVFVPDDEEAAVILLLM